MPWCLAFKDSGDSQHLSMGIWHSVESGRNSLAYCVWGQGAWIKMYFDQGTAFGVRLALTGLAAEHLGGASV